jgi:hypothetical protein
MGAEEGSGAEAQDETGVEVLRYAGSCSQTAARVNAGLPVGES